MIHYIGANDVENALKNGLISPGYALSIGNESLADSMLEKYKARSGAITRDQVIAFLKKLRGRDDALNAIYAVNQPIPEEAMAFANAQGRFTNEVPLEIDLAGMDYDVENLYQNKKDITKSIIDNIKKKRVLFKDVPHQAIYTPNGFIPPDRLRLL